jgi:hypothetical protein
VDHRYIAAVAVVALGLAAGCGKSSPAPAPADSAAPAAATGSGKGIDAPGNDASVVGLGRKALGCSYGAYGFPLACAEVKAFLDDEHLREGKADATLTSFLEDPSEQVRWLGARALSTQGKAYRTDKALAERVVKAAEDEKSKTVAQELGGAVGGIKHAETGLGQRIQAMAKSHPVQTLRTSLLSRMLFTNGESLYGFVRDIAKDDPDPIVRKAAMSAFWSGTPPQHEGETCAMWLGFVDDAVDEVAGEAAYLCAYYPHGGGCKKEWDPLLDKIEKKAKDGAVKSAQMASALSFLNRQKEISDPQRKRTLAVARTLLENKANAGMARGRALEFIAERDPDGPKLLDKYKDDADLFVRTRARDLADKASKTGKPAEKTEGGKDKK